MNTIEQISGADLLAIRNQGAECENYAIICNNNNKRLTQAYLSLQMENVNLRYAIQKTLEENGHLADGENCTLIHLKRALGVE